LPALSDCERIIVGRRRGASSGDRFSARDDPRGDGGSCGRGHRQAVDGSKATARGADNSADSWGEPRALHPVAHDQTRPTLRYQEVAGHFQTPAAQTVSLGLVYRLYKEALVGQRRTTV